MCCLGILLSILSILIYSGSQTNNRSKSYDHLKFTLKSIIESVIESVIEICCWICYWNLLSKFVIEIYYRNLLFKFVIQIYSWNLLFKYVLESVIIKLSLLFYYLVRPIWFIQELKREGVVKGKSENITQKPILRASNTSVLPSKRETCE